MRIIPTRKFLKGIRFKGLLRDQRGQGILEYMLVLIVILSVVFVAARPVIARLQKKFETGIKGGIFKEDPTGGQFYYFPLK